MNPEPATAEAVAASVIGLPGGMDLALNGGSDRAREAGAEIRDNAMAQFGYTAVYEGRPVDDDPFEVMSHEDIWSKAQALQAEHIDATSGNWRILGNNAATDAAAFALKVTNQVGTNWQGAAAEAAGQGVDRYATSAGELMLAADGLSQKVQATSAGVSATRAALPPPVPYGTGEKIFDVGSWLTRTLLPGDLKSFQHLHEEAEEAARTVMKSQYAPVIREAAVQVPVLPPALNPLSGSEGLTFSSPGASRPDSGGSGWGGMSGGSAGPGSAGTTTANPGGDAAATPQAPSTEASSWAPAESAASPAGQTNSSPYGAGQGNGGAQGTGAPSSTSSAAAGSPVGGALAPGGSGGRPGGSGAGSRFGSGGSGVSGGSGTVRGGGGLGPGSLGAGGFGGPGGGSSVGGPSGSGLGAAGGGGVAGAAGATAGRPGTPGMGMGGMAPAAGRGGGGGDDDVHQTPGYLIDAVNGDELIGSLPLVAPPVLGE
ncbi:hypothetical protein CH263_15705 [Rhodococcus sp. 06-1059B-a]|nr:hypothetical protein [Rhodococcus sp. 06-1059B-a]OZD63734.1 hypothetical protein CH263_15705 [Rhodococcus sp. 06-1059B-a]